MMCQYRFNCNKCTTLDGNIIIEKAMHVWGTGNTREISVSSAQLCCEPTIALKK